MRAGSHPVNFPIPRVATPGKEITVCVLPRAYNRSADEHRIADCRYPQQLNPAVGSRWPIEWADEGKAVIDQDHRPTAESPTGTSAQVVINPVIAYS